MTFDPTKPVQTRDGLAARIICTNMKRIGENDRVIVFLQIIGDGAERVSFVRLDGRYYEDQEETGDLINIPEEPIAVKETFEGMTYDEAQFLVADEGFSRVVVTQEGQHAPTFTVIATRRKD